VLSNSDIRQIFFGPLVPMKSREAQVE